MVGKIVTHSINNLSKGLHVYYMKKLWIILSINDNKTVVTIGENLDSKETIEVPSNLLSSLNIVDDDTNISTPLSFLDWERAVAYDLVNTDKSVQYIAHRLGWYSHEATIDLVGHASITENTALDIFTEEDMSHAFSAGEHKMEYPKSAPSFELFIEKLKQIKIARKTS